MNKIKAVSVDQCPLCRKANDCGNLSAEKNNTCWCMDDTIKFSEALLNQVSNAAKNKSCICKACALKHQSVRS